MVASARKHKLTELSVTEHVSQFKELRDTVKFGSIHSRGRIFRDLNEYNSEFLKVNEKDNGIKVNRGLEVDFAPGFEDQVGQFVNQMEWDILLCSVHEFGDSKDIETSISGNLDEKSTQIRWHEYFRLQEMALASDFVPFKVLAHPVRMARGRLQPPPESDHLLLNLAKTAQRKDKALELNGNDITYSPDLVRRLAIACSRASCRVSIGSDAHRPENVFKNLGIAMQLVDEFKLELY